MGPEFVGKTKDNMSKDSLDLSSKAVEEPFDEAQTVLGTLYNLKTCNLYNVVSTSKSCVQCTKMMSRTVNC